MPQPMTVNVAKMYDIAESDYISADRSLAFLQRSLTKVGDTESVAIVEACRLRLKAAQNTLKEEFDEAAVYLETQIPF